MTALSSKPLRDLAAHRSRSVLAVLAIALGVASFEAVLASYGILVRELNGQYLATNPPSATIRTDRVDEALLEAVAKTPGVGAVEARRTVQARVRKGAASWKPLVLFVAADLSKVRLGTLRAETGAWPPKDGELAVERDAFQVIGAAVGDTVSVRTSSGTERTLRVTGRVHDVGQAQARMENLVYGYASIATLAALGEEPVLDRLAILASEDRFDEAHVKSVARAAARTVEAAGHPVRALDVPEPGKHPHADIMGVLLLAMSTFGLFVTALAAAVVVNLFAAILGAEIRQIGVMRTVGGTPGRIARVYLAHALALGAGAAVVAVPAGLLGCRALCRYLAVFLNFDIDRFAVPLWVFALVALVALAVPVLAAAWPVARASRTSIREALSDAGTSRTEFREGRLDRRLARAGGVTRPVLLAVRNGFRKTKRLTLTVATLTLGGAFFMSGLNVRTSLIRTLDRLFAARKSDLSVTLAAMSDAADVERAVRGTPGVTAFEGWIATQGEFPDAAHAATPAHPQPAGGLHGGTAALGPGRFPVFALPATTRLLAPEISSGRWLSPEDSKAVVLNSALATRHGAKAGDKVTLRLGPSEEEWLVAGIAKEPLAPPTAYVPRRLFDEMHPGMVNTVRVALARSDAASIETAKANLETSLAAAGVHTAAITSKADARRGFDEHMRMIYVFLVVAACVVASVGGLGLTTTTALNVRERRRELGVMRAIGATPFTVAAIVVAEAVVTGALAWALAVVFALPIGQLAGDHLLLALFRSRVLLGFDARGAAIWLAVSLLGAAAAAALPAWRASRRPVREALSYE